MASLLLNKILNRFAVRCLILHPVSFPNKGPVVEQYLAEEAIGLSKSLGWDIVKGPYWNAQSDTIVPLAVHSRRNNQLYIEANPQQIRDGDYLKTSIGNGVLYQDGLVFEGQDSQSEGDMYKQWQNQLLRQSLANSSLIKVRSITRKTFFTKGKLHFISDYLAKSQADCLFVNAELKPAQAKNLRKFIQARLNNMAPVYAFKGGLDSESETDFETEQQSELRSKRNSPDFKTIKIFDRFSIILQIFAQRTTTKLAKLQVELSYLNYLRTRLVRQGATYSSNLNLFTGDLMKTQQINMEVISAKQRRAARTMSGQGESQLQIERRQLRDKEANIRRQIGQETRLRKIQQQKVKKRNMGMPVVALVGYTNVGKSALMNALMKKKQVVSKDILFQTLNTTSRNVTLPSGTKISLLDTIGFITNLPVQMVEAFKSTLEEVSHADLVIHLRDVSHPHQELQKTSVLKILKQINFQASFYNKRMIQVWNKVDLMPDQPLPQGSLGISCLTGKGLKELSEVIQGKLRKLGDVKQYGVQFGPQMHEQVIEWLRVNTNHSFHIKTQYNYEPTQQFPQGSVKLYLQLDEVAKNKLNKFLNPDQSRKKTKKGMPPPEGW